RIVLPMRVTVVRAGGGEHRFAFAERAHPLDRKPHLSGKPRLKRLLPGFEAFEADVMKLMRYRVFETIWRLFLNGEKDRRSIARLRLPYEAVGTRLDLG